MVSTDYDDHPQSRTDPRVTKRISKTSDVAIESPGPSSPWEKAKQIAGIVLGLTVFVLLFYGCVYQPLLRPLFFPQTVRAELAAEESIRGRFKEAAHFVCKALEKDWQGYTAWYATDEFFHGLRYGYFVKSGAPFDLDSEIMAHLEFDVGVSLRELSPDSEGYGKRELGSRLEGMNFTVAVWEKQAGSGDFAFLILRRWLPNP